METPSPIAPDDTPKPLPAAAAEQQQHAGNSGEGAASALAHLKTQAREQRREALDRADDPGPSSD